MKWFVIIILSVGLLWAGSSLLKGQTTSGSNAGSNVSMEDGKQVITISAKGGYSPKLTSAKANAPTVIKMVTKNTYDCSSSLIIPQLNVTTSLEPSGTTTLTIPSQAPGTTLRGLCGMGMYRFEITFS